MVRLTLLRRYFGAVRLSFDVTGNSHAIGSLNSDAVALGCLVLCIALPLSGCATFRAPTLRIERAAIGGVTLTGVQVDVDLIAENHAQTEVIIDHVSTELELGGHSLGQIEQEPDWRLAATGPTRLQASFVIAYGEIASLLMTMATATDIPFVVRGEASIANRPVTVEFEYRGSVSRQQLMEMAGQGLGFGLGF